MACETALEKAASRHIFDLKLELGRTNALSANEFAGIEASLRVLLATNTSTSAKRCHAQYPAQRKRYQSWFSQQAGSLAKQARERLDRTCSRRTEMFIQAHKHRVDTAVAANRLAKAAQLAGKMEEGLRNDLMIRQCESTKEDVGVLLSSYIPSIKNQAALPHVISKMSEAYFGAHDTLEAAQAALQSSGRSLTAAPTATETPEGQAALREQLNQCRSNGRALIELGADADLSLHSAAGDSEQLASAIAYCQAETPKLDHALARFEAHNIAYRTTILKRWLRTNIKSWSMEKVYNAKGRPWAQSTNGGSIQWTYQERGGSCLQVRFSAKGKKLGEKSLACAK